MGFELETKILKNQKGTSIVEFAIILPLLLMLIFGILEFGVMFYDRQVITNASREGARAGIVQALTRPTPGEIAVVVQTYCNNRLFNLGGPRNLTISVTTNGNPTGCANFAEDLRVSVTFPYDFLIFSRLISAFGNTINLTADTIMKCE